ncbi:hypothetical protein M427DRAFT_332466 [Gonapodya prolifera JEL478]|uniref:VPS9 domain-containing protein n=1 Tax=Gonapodya prolifera (strain JEL478) TaxID=1344416 RepID=A0A139AEU6_GONPJ|nr:hypothetical protein M427DRAFT_332466 [Gonapodya prolifera JEL478]|eukprot:KXS14943.1 hypothetical protein M427DRAFT_332466 [Gonapodya prolifera JEL478]
MEPAEDRRDRQRASSASVAGSRQPNPAPLQRSSSSLFQRSWRSSWTPTLDHDPVEVLSSSDRIFTLEGMKPVLTSTARFALTLFQHCCSSLDSSESAASDTAAELLHAHLRSQHDLLLEICPSSSKPSVTNRVVEGIESYLVERVIGPAHHSWRGYAVTRFRTRDEGIQFRAAAIHVAGDEVRRVKWPPSADSRIVADELRRLAGLHLLTLDAFPTPSTKISAIINVQKGIADVLSHHAQPVAATFDNGRQAAPSVAGTSADDLLSFLIWLIVEINPPRLSSNIAFIRRFRYRHYSENSVEEYALTTFEAAVSFISDFDLMTLGIDPSISERYPI